MKVICFGQQNWDWCWTAKQQICVRLGGRGHPVLYVDPDPVEQSLGPSDTLRALAPAATGFGLRQAAPGVQLYTHVHAPPLGWRLNHALRARRLHGIARRLDMLDAVALAIHPAALPAMDAVRPRARVYYAVDEMSAFHRDAEASRRMRHAEELVMRASDAVIAVSPRLHERFAQVHPNAHLVQNAADVAHFEPQHLAAARPHPALSGASPPTMVLVGQIDERVDQGLLRHVARARPDWRIVLAGRVKPGVNVAALEAEPNILLLGYQDYADLPSVLRAADVCIVPYHLTPLTHGCNPLKAWEYLATGRPVVATPVDALLPMRGLIALAESRDAFLAALDAAVADPEAGRDRRLEFARRNSWETRVDQLERIFEGAIARADARRHGPRPAVPGATLAGERLTGEALTRRRRAAFRVTRIAGRAYHVLRVAGRTLRGRPQRVRRILVARRSRLGDTVVLLPTLRALRRNYPDAEIVLGVQQDFNAHGLVAPFVDGIRTIEVLDHPSRVAGVLDMAKLFLAGFDLVLCGASYFLMREAWLTGAPRIAGVDDGQPLQTLADVRVRLLPASHEVDNNLALVTALGGDIADDERAPRLAAASDSRTRAAAVRGRLGVPAGARVVVIHPGSQKPSRRWPADRFAALTAGLLAERPDVHVILTGVADEAALVAGIRDALPESVRPRAHDAVGRTDLNDLLALLAHAAVFVCNDTGTMHVARALGVPLLALLGPENDRRWGPYPAGWSPAISLRHEVPCAPCVRWDCAPLYCLRGIATDDALAAVRDLLDGRVNARALDRRAVVHDWASLRTRGQAVPAVAVVWLAGGEAPTFPGEMEMDVVQLPPRSSAPALARAVLDATDATVLAVAHAETPWTADALGRCLATLVREDEAVAADPIAGGYRTIDVPAALRTGGVVLRRATLERLAAQGSGPRAGAPQKLAPSSTALA